MLELGLYGIGVAKMADYGTLSEIFGALIPLAASLGFGMASALLYNYSERGFAFSRNVFLISAGIAILILIWQNALEYYWGGLTIIFYIIVLLGNTGGDEYE